MVSLISRAIAQVSSFFKGIQVKHLLAPILAVSLLLSSNLAVGTNVDPGPNDKSLSRRLDNTAHQIDSERPKTTGEWKQEARETEGSPVERLQNIAEESAQAVKEWGGLYPDTADRSARDLDD